MQARVDILMGTLNGGAWLGQQLASIAAQSDVNWRLYVSDDGSRDCTLRIVRAFADAQPGRVTLVAGPRRGVAANYLQLLAQSDPTSNYVALCDQDDVWHPARLRRAIARLVDVGPTAPAIYASRTWESRARTNTPKLSRKIPRRACFENALLQNVLAGNTMVLNRAALQIVRQAKVDAARPPFHDWWLYALLSGSGARIVLDDRATVLYRQHNNNLLGAHGGILPSVLRIRRVLSTEYGQWVRENLAALSANRLLLTPGSDRSLSEVTAALREPGILRGIRLRRSGAFRQQITHDAFVVAAASMGRI